MPGVPLAKEGESVATGKRYYWMKLKESFMTSDTIDYMMSQPNGANYVVLYQMLCLKTINTNGRLSRQIGEVIIPYDIPKIVRDLKYFNADTVRVALELYKSFGLIYEDVDGTLVLADHVNLVGSETDAAARMRNSRAARNNVLPSSVTGGEHSANNVTPEIEYRDRDKEIEIRDRDREEVIVSDETICRTEDVRRVLEAWNALGLQNIKKLSPGTNRHKLLHARLKEYSLDDVLAAIEKVRASPFLLGQNRKSWQITFDWFIKPNNFPKVLSGNYDSKPRGAETPPSGNVFAQMWQEQYGGDHGG